MKALVQCVYLLAPLILFSCNDDASPIGSDFFEGSAISMTTIDTLTIHTSTMKFDSMATGDAARLLVGYHEDEELGKISSSAYFQLSTQGSFEIDKLTTKFSRVEMLLIHDGYSYYDTTTSVSLNVHQLKEPLDYKSDNFYNTSTFKYDPTPLGTITYRARPNEKDTVFIPLSAAFGEEIIRLAQNSATQVSTITDFIDYFDGIALIPTGTNGPIVGFTMTPEIRIYYIDNSVTPSVESYLSLTFQDFTKYNHITSDKSSTALSALKSGGHLDSEKTSGKGYLQAGVGLGLRLDIPYLRSILIENDGLTVLSAVLEISPAQDNGNHNVALPTPLLMQRVNYKNQLVSSYTQQGTLVEDFYLERDTHYTVDVTTYVTQQMTLEELNENAIVFTTDDSSFRTSVDRIYVDDQRMKLTITCLVY